jgi:glycosyl transferase family 2
MKLVMTLLVRDEADIVDDAIAYHLGSGVDFVIATDHASQDGTTEILERYARDGYLHLIRESQRELSQAEWVTRMARLAASEFGADWVMNADADEFWWPRKGTLREVLEAVSERFGVVPALARHFAPRPDVTEPVCERMVARRPCVVDRDDLFHVQVQVVHRARPDISIPSGNHDAHASGLLKLHEWFPIEVLHFPVRNLEQMRAKYTRRISTAPFARRMRARIAERGADGVFSELVVDDGRLVREVAAGSLAVDVRLRDRMRSSDRAHPALPDGIAPESEDESERAFVADVATAMTHDTWVKTERDLDNLRSRLDNIRGAAPAARTLGSHRLEAFAEPR